ncbi:uncharacterized protein LACBIDRAFT_313372 [Laccaria bicolor S238N-H82]|uniref:Predicted protein n=1 Tax=Laccaria bicolor (strain S238N-H82 / ATCC MYA-4686) TaxID=486041 RepID=B0DY66_LACBS|nr:uncharacterized protein LACBIDRAFT_313372 [Laccaria bicolor S238N-H82]EDR00467.1 predicted protein [Laccaria bicolor S238N-H82]|eukprot:XP_001888859.1 predicted protein [Laccaria bicolor S238N-H82]
MFLVLSTSLGARDGPAVLSTYKNFAVDGCFTFVSHLSHARIDVDSDIRPTTLSFELGTSADMTVETCIDSCISAGYIRAGLVAGSQCWCGNVIKPGNIAVSNSSCSTSCPGNTSVVCGGVNDMLEYSIRPPVIAQEVGSFGQWESSFRGDFICLPDIPTLRSLHHLQERSDFMTVERCLNACDAGGFSLAGLEFGSECWCGNADMYGRPPIFPSSSACNFPCAGNPAQVCGGSNALNEYVFPTRSISVGPPAPFNFPYNGTWNYRGCLSDEAYLSGGQRILPYQPSNPIGPEEMTPFLCMDRCSADGWVFAGFEFSQECWCGNLTQTIINANSVPNSQCNMACTNYADFTCGGSNRLGFASKN